MAADKGRLPEPKSAEPTKAEIAQASLRRATIENGQITTLLRDRDRLQAQLQLTDAKVNIDDAVKRMVARRAELESEMAALHKTVGPEFTDIICPTPPKGRTPRLGYIRGSMA